MSSSYGSGIVPNLDPEGTPKALLHSLLMIIFSEIGDKTFLIAAILAMRHSRVTVFAGALLALVVMSALSAAVGHLLPTLIPRRWTQLAAAILFLVFGGKMLSEGRHMSSGNQKMQEEMREAEQEIEEDQAAVDGTGCADENGEVIPLEEIEEGGRPHSGHLANGNGPHIASTNGHIRQPSKSEKKLVSSFHTIAEGTRNFCSFFLGPVFVQAFVLTFLGEWGDRSQIATIALAAAHNMYLVALGTIVGHSCCTALAVVGGRYVSSKISVKHVTLGGAALFVLFGFIYIYEAFSASDIDPRISTIESNTIQT